ncbi:cyanophycinase [Polyangium fumosum]|uniref:Cyanophycinase n=1 Tax=Polyangium fumosum TaxID=889272 RepID=A0A4U1JIA2_9BACT|nr:cyanophycinase [Polyangium fumosum]
MSPEPPAGLEHYVTGNDADADVTPAGPGLILMGGSTDVDAAFTWWKPRIAGGDVVVLRASGADGYNEYLQELSASDSVETMLVTSKELANSDYVKWRVEHAEGIFLAGGDQSDYVTFWRGTALASAIASVWQRGGIVGGTSAGCAVLGEFVFAAHEGSVYSDEALLDPYNVYMTMERDFFAFPPLAGFITDSHFVPRDRMGRLVGFLGRILTDGWAPKAKGIGVDEQTAVVIDAQGKGEVIGEGKVYLVVANEKPTSCEAGKPLVYSGLSYHRLAAGDTLQFPSGETSVPAEPLSAANGVTSPADPY